MMEDFSDAIKIEVKTVGELARDLGWPRNRVNYGLLKLGSHKAPVLRRVGAARLYHASIEQQLKQVFSPAPEFQA